jgi:hypothetical protein
MFMGQVELTHYSDEYLLDITTNDILENGLLKESKYYNGIANKHSRGTL